METASILCLALGFDWMLGEPPNRWHPVAWMGRLVTLGGRRALSEPWREFSRGAGLTIAGLIVVAIILVAVERGLGLLPVAPRVLLEGLLLKFAFSLRALCQAARRVQGSLASSDLEPAREQLGRDLVSRPTGALSAPLLASAAVESVAENFTDSIVAPLGFYLAFGLAGAYAYRFVNTADAMIGYRDRAHEYLGKVAARLDDALNFIPARLAALMLGVAAPFAGGEVVGAWRIMWTHHTRTASPNAGWTMAAMAGALGVTLEKPGHYQLGVGPLPGPLHIKQSVRLVQVASLLFIGLAAAAEIVVTGRSG